ncbi:MAG TPA: hypothetical protein VFV50_13640 [Bdellovibrionales bacterium]|nr:hypothetical protein [Bdellovibrionales bacterium]
MKSEREFLHDVSTPVATALFIADSLAESLAAADAAQAKKLLAKLLEIRDLIERRRNQIKSDKV